MIKNKKPWWLISIAIIFLFIGLSFNLVSVASNLYFVLINTANVQIVARIIVFFFFTAFGLTQVLSPLAISFASMKWKIAVFCILPFCIIVSVWSNLGNVNEVNNSITTKSVSSNSAYKDAQENVSNIKASIKSIEDNLKNYQSIIDDITSTKDEKMDAIENKSYVDRTQYKPALQKLEDAKKVRTNAEVEAATNSSDENVFLKYLDEYKLYIAISFEIISFIFVSVAIDILTTGKNQAEMRGNKNRKCMFFSLWNALGNISGNVSHVSTHLESASMGNRETSTQKMGNVQNMTKSQYGKLNDWEIANILKDLNMVNKSQKDIRNFLKIRAERVTKIIKIAKANQNKIRLIASQ